MFGRVLSWLGSGDDTDTDTDLDWTDPETEYGGDGPVRRYVCAECGATVKGVGPGERVTCPGCGTVFDRVPVPDHAVCPRCRSRIDNATFYPETRRDTEFAACEACDYRWESDPRG
ncbi:hypothetical protein [Haloplanus sp.]|uniref:hypothetical protein n=1 Tax=Haloplanus sp. TaxID=1961696 RepID=UPI0026088AC2|nr:hypothetical protein [Haloplanus sp.]